MTITQVMESEWFNGAVPGEADVHETMMTRKREVEARIKAEKQAKKESKAGKKKEYHRGGEEGDPNENYQDDESLEIMATIKVHDPRVKMMGINTLLYTDKHPLVFEDELDTLAGEWPSLEFEKKKHFKYDLKVTVTRPAAGEDNGEEEEQKGEESTVTEDIQVGLRMEVKAIEGESSKWCLEFTRLSMDQQEAKAVTHIDFYKGFSDLTVIFEDLAQEDE